MFQENGSAENRQQEAYDLRDGELDFLGERRQKRKRRSQARWTYHRDMKAALMPSYRVSQPKNQVNGEREVDKKLKETCHNIMYIYFCD